MLQPQSAMGSKLLNGRNEKHNEDMNLFLIRDLEMTILVESYTIRLFLRGRQKSFRIFLSKNE